MDQFKRPARELLVAIVVLAAYFTRPALANMEPGSQKQIGAWHLAAYLDDASGLFSHCSISATYPNGISVIFGFSANVTWRIGWYGNTWSLTPGNTIDLKFGIDASTPKPYKLSLIHI